MDRTRLVVGVVVWWAFSAPTLIGCTSDDGEDKVISVILKCDKQVSIGVERVIRPTTGADCENSSVMNARQEVTVRTPGGNVYTVDAPVVWLIRLGDSWPPK